ncbi:MAG: hypothetical protein Q9178_003335 [Gyalolechia marmorata]
MPPASSTTSKPPAPSTTSTWVETETGNKVSRRAQLHGTQHITLGGRCVLSPSVCIRGDLVRPPPPPPPLPSTTSSTNTNNKKPHPITSVSLGKYVILSPHVLLKPPLRVVNIKAQSLSTTSSGEREREKGLQQTLQYHPLLIGSHVFIGPHCTVQAASIGDHVVIESGAVVCNMAILKEGCRVLRGSVVPEGMVVPPGVVVGGRPARVVGEVGVGWGVGEDEVGGEGGDLRDVWRGAGKEGGVGWEG